MVEGLSGVLPVSAAAHLIVVPGWLGAESPLLASATFAAAIRLGLLGGLVAALRGDLARLLGAWSRSLARRGPGDDPGPRPASAYLLALVPAVVLGVAGAGLFDPFFRGRSVMYVGAVMVVGAGWLWLGERQGRQVRGWRQVHLRDGLILGLVQGVAVMPGLGLAGTTLAAGQLLGLEREAAGRFALLLAVPVIAATLIVETPEAVRIGLAANAAPPLVAGALAAAVAAFVAVAVLLAWLRRRATDVFVLYRFGFAAAIVVSLLSR